MQIAAADVVDPVWLDVDLSVHPEPVDGDPAPHNATTKELPFLIVDQLRLKFLVSGGNWREMLTKALEVVPPHGAEYEASARAALQAALTASNDMDLHVAPSVGAAKIAGADTPGDAFAEALEWSAVRAIVIGSTQSQL